jgi:glucosylceramidase
MKSTGTMIGGELLPRWYPGYAEYFMKFIQRGAVRLESGEGKRLFAQIAFRNPDGSLVLVLINGDGQERSVRVSCKNRYASVRLNGRSVATLVWRQS